MGVSANSCTDPIKAYAVKAEEHAQEAGLWLSFRNGDREALNQIFEKHARHIFAYGKKITPDHGLISDCIQDLFVEIWEKREVLASEVKSIRFYLLKAIRRRIVRRLSSDHRVVGRPIPEEYSLKIQCDIQSQLVDNQLSADIENCVRNSLSCLTEGQREAVYLKFYESLSYEQIAIVMNTNVKSVYNHISKSIVSLRKVLKSHPVIRGS